MPTSASKARVLATTVNLTLILAAVFVGVHVVGGYRNARPARTEMPKLIEPGMHLEIPGVDWATAKRNVLILVSSTCAGCFQSVPVYRSLVAHAGSNPAIKVTAVSGQPVAKTREWLDAQGIKVPQVVSLVEPASVGFSLYPTLLILDDRGVVSDVFLGGLPDGILNALSGRLENPARGRPINNADYVPEVTMEEAQKLFGVSAPQLIDTRSRAVFAANHLVGAINIPVDEFRSRSAKEIDTSKPVAVVCYPEALVACRAAGKRLQAMGARRLVLVVK